MMEMLHTPSRRGLSGIATFRYYRIWITGYNNQTAVVISKWGLYLGADDITQLYPYTPNQSSAYSGQYLAANLFNHSYSYGPTHHWQVNSGPVQWVEVGFAAPKSVDRFRISHDITNKTHEVHLPKDWVFRGSNDRVTWTDILPVQTYTTTQWAKQIHHDWYL